MAEEELVNFLNLCRLKNSEVMLFSRCSYLFDKEATKSLEVFAPKSKKRRKWYICHRQEFSFTKSYISFINNFSTTNYVKAHVQKWVHSTYKNVQYGKNNVVKGSTSNTVTKNVTTDTHNPNESRKYVVIPIFLT